MTATTFVKTQPRLTEVRRHQVYRLNRPARGTIFGKLRRSLRTHFAHN
jgi:hypothetical protein